MLCPVCKTENRPGAKFCQECSVRLELRCPFCGAATAAGAKYCIQCGSKQELKCPLCSSATQPGAKFCQECGTRLEFACFTCGTLTPPSAKFCHSCGSRLESRCSACGSLTILGAHFCNSCGISLTPPATAPAVTATSAGQFTTPPVQPPLAPVQQPQLQPEIIQSQQPSAPVVQPQVVQQPASTDQPAPVGYPEQTVTQTQPQPSAFVPPVSAGAPVEQVLPIVAPDNVQQAIETPIRQAPPPAQTSHPEPTVAEIIQVPSVSTEPSIEPTVQTPPAQAADSFSKALREPQDSSGAAPVIPIAKEDERRLVTVLFGDVSGFTAMSEKLDAEDMKAIMDSCLKMLADQVDKYEGTVDKFEGDLIMATWGAPNAHEDDAERAVLAAIGMQEALAKFSDNLEKRRGFTLKMRIGLNTGEVIAGVVGSGRDKDYTVMGDVVNTASRFESNGTPGRVMVGQKTYDLSKHLVDFETLEPITVKGKSEPLPVYEVIGIKQERGQRRGISGLESPMVGRSSEVQRLLAEFQKIKEERHPRIVTLLGTPGMGKSRLLGEFEKHLSEKAISYSWVKGRSLPYGQTITYYALGEMVKTAFGIKESDSIEEVRERLIDGVRDVLNNSLRSGEVSSEQVEEEAWQITHRLAYAIGVSYPDSIMNKINPSNVKDELFWAWRQFFYTWASITPLVVVFEDLHWADEVILDLINHIATTIDSASIMLLCISRPELLERSPVWGEDSSSRSLIHLTPLTPEEGVALLDNLLLNNRLSRRFKESIVQRAGGQPFFIEEILRIYLESHAIVKGPGGWVLSEMDADLKVPDTISATISARLDRLDLMEKSLIQRASVVGTDFWESSLAYPAPALGPEVSALAQLTEKEFIRSKPESSVVDDNEYAFQNTLVHDVTYQGLTKARRSREHLRVGKWLEVRAGDRLEEFIELLAHHFGQAANVEVASMEGDYTGVVQAIYYLWEAAERARARQSNADALSRYDRALELLSEIKDIEDAPQDVNGVDSYLVALRLFIGRAQTLEPLARYDEAIEDLDVVLKGAQELGIVSLQALSLHQMAKILRIKGEPAMAEEKATEAARLYQEVNDLAGNAQCLLVLGEVFSDQSKLSQFEAVAKEATELGRQVGSLWVEARGSTLIGTGCAYQGKAEEGLQHIEKAVDIYKEMGDRRGIATSLLMLGRINHMLGRPKAAAQHIIEAVEMFEELGDRRAMASASFNLGLMSLERGDVQEAQHHAERGIAMTSNVGESSMRIRCLLLLAQAQVESGDPEGAIRNLIETDTLCTTHAQTSALPEVYRVTAQAYLGLGKLDEAEKYALKGCEVVAEDDPYSLGTTRLVYALVLEAKNRNEEAEEAYTKALGYLEEAGEEFEIGLIHHCYGMFLMKREQYGPANEHLLEAREAFVSLEAQARIDTIDTALEKIEASLKSVAGNPL